MGKGLAGLLKLAPRCTACGLEYERFNVGDGAAPFLIFIVATIVIIASQVTEFRLHPPWWVHVLLWLPLTLALSLGLMRVAKGLFVALEFRHNAGEGRRQ
ncbi:MAG: DUF983 domain-containing protein [Sphingomonadales bacterium]